MKTVLCYGDSNTWGYIPGIGKRYTKKERWTGILREILKEECYIIEEGLCGRTTVFNDPICGYRSGKDYLLPCLRSHMPIDLVIIMLGTNDLKIRFSASTYEIAKGIGSLVEIIRGSNTGVKEGIPKILLVSPPVTKETDIENFYEDFVGSEEKSRKFSKYYKDIANQYNINFWDTSERIESSNVDGIHLDLLEHKMLGEMVAKKIKGMF